MKFNHPLFSDPHLFALPAPAWLKHLTHEIYYRYLFAEADFLKALQREELAIHYQPIVDMHTGLWLGAEALMRWPDRGNTFNPEATFTLLERSPIICSVTRWVCQQVMEEYSQSLWACDRFYITINLSPADVMDRTFPDFIKVLTTRYAISASHVAFEITERVALCGQLAEIQLNRLRALGHLVLLDDFGTGYSNFASLVQLPIDAIKIDKLFTHHAGNTSDIILLQLLQMVRRLNLDVIIEGVETQAQAQRLRFLGADKAQGWLYSKALPAEDFVRAYFSMPERGLYTASENEPPNIPRV